MSGAERRVRLLVTIVLGPAEHEVALERVAVTDDVDPLADVPMLGRVLAANLPDGLSDWEQYRSRKRLIQCLLMDQYDVPHGEKAVAIALARYWTPALSALFGDPDDPSSINRWRRTRGSVRQRRLADMATRRAGHGGVRS